MGKKKKKNKSRTTTRAQKKKNKSVDFTPPVDKHEQSYMAALREAAGGHLFDGPSNAAEHGWFRRERRWDGVEFSVGKLRELLRNYAFLTTMDHPSVINVVADLERGLAIIEPEKAEALLWWYIEHHEYDLGPDGLDAYTDEQIDNKTRRALKALLKVVADPEWDETVSRICVVLGFVPELTTV